MSQEEDGAARVRDPLVGRKFSSGEGTVSMGRVRKFRRRRSRENKGCARKKSVDGGRCSENEGQRQPKCE